MRRRKVLKKVQSDCFPKENAREKTLEKNVKENIAKHRDAKENYREKLLKRMQKTKIQPKKV